MDVLTPRTNVEWSEMLTRRRCEIYGFGRRRTATMMGVPSHTYERYELEGKLPRDPETCAIIRDKLGVDAMSLYLAFRDRNTVEAMERRRLAALAEARDKEFARSAAEARRRERDAMRVRPTADEAREAEARRACEAIAGTGGYGGPRDLDTDRKRMLFAAFVRHVTGGERPVDFQPREVPPLRDVTVQRKKSEHVARAVALVDAGVRTKEAAERLGISRGTLSGAVYRARRAEA